MPTKRRHGRTYSRWVQLQKMKDINQTTIIAAIRSALGGVPVIGTMLNELVFDGRARLKQERINRFILMIHEYMEGASEVSVDLKYLKSEEFSDLFESIIRRVSVTRSSTKLNRFKQILVGQIEGKKADDFVETYLELISRLNDDQIKILLKYRSVDESNGDLLKSEAELNSKLNKLEIKLPKELESQRNGKANNVDRLKSKIGKLGVEKYIVTEKLKENALVSKAESHGLKEGQFSFYLNDLFAKGLLERNEVQYDQSFLPPSKYYEITEFGREFLKFINET